MSAGALNSSPVLDPINSIMPAAIGQLLMVLLLKFTCGDTRRGV